MSLGQYINSVRIARGMSYEKLAELSGVSRGYLHLLIHNENNVGIYTLAKIAVALDTSLANLVSVVDEWKIEIRDPLPFEDN